MNGLLRDTLVWRFLPADYVSPLYETVLDFFKYLSEFFKTEYVYALGSNQRVFVKKNFQGKAKMTAKLSQKGTDAENTPLMYKNAQDFRHI